MTQNSLARLLRPLGIASKAIKFEGQTLRGYLMEDFRDAFERYLPSAEDETPEEDKTPEKERQAKIWGEDYTQQIH